MTTVGKPREERVPAADAGPLSGVRVLDLTRVAAGPYAAQTLADMGADVVKVERPGLGDDSRRLDIAHENGESGYYWGINRGKRSIAIDLSSDDGRRLAERLIAWADVVMESFRPGVAARLGVGYEQARALNRDVVYCSISGFGSDPGLAERPAYDVIAQAVTGIMAITGEPDRGPAKCGAPVGDMACGMFAVIGIQAALLHRERTGQGQKVEVTLVGATMTLLSQFVSAAALGTPFMRRGSAHNTIAPYQAFAGSDGAHFVVAAATDAFWERLATAIGRSDLCDDPRFATNGARAVHQEALAAILAEEFVRAPASVWIDRIGAANVPVCPVQSLSDVLTDPVLAQAGAIVDSEHPEIGSVKSVALPLRFSATHPRAVRRPPMLDEHHDEIVEMLREEEG